MRIKTIPFLALLRGINVGGRNIIPMAALKTSFEAMGFDNVRTYIQSGNILFTAGEDDRVRLMKKIEERLSRDFSYESRALVVTYNQLKSAVEDAPRGFGKKPDRYRYDVIFLFDRLTPQKALQSVKIKEGVDTAAAGNGALYFSRLISKASQSRLSGIIKLPIYQYMTIRNWNTTRKLWELMGLEG